MRKVLLASVIVLLAMAGCKDEPMRCWKCKYTYAGGGKPDMKGDTTVCNLTRTDIELREDVQFDGAPAGYQTFVINNCSGQ